MEFSKHVAAAKITDPTAVQAKCSALGQTYHNGAIFAEIPEIGFSGANLVYCRYGLSIPYLRIQTGWKLLVEPTIGDRERWFYVGLVDCVGSNPDTSMQMLIQFVSQVIYASTSNTLHLSSKTASEAFVKGTAFKTELDKHKQLIQDLQTAINGWSPVAQDGGAALKTALATWLTLPMPDYSQILSTKIFGE